jgi:molybdate transport system permease protein
MSSNRGRSSHFEKAMWTMLGLTLAASIWLILANLGKTDSQALRVLAGRPWFWRSLWLSLFTATVTTFIAALLGIPTAYALSRFSFRGRLLAGVVLDAALVLPASTVGLTLMVLFQYPPVLKLETLLGVRVVHSLGAVVAAQLVLSLAFGIQAWRAAFDGVNPRCEHVARSLGSSSARTFFTITLPGARSGIVAGLVLAWTRALAEFGAVLLLAGTFRMRDAGQFSGLTRWLHLSNADLLSVGMWIEIEGGRTEQGVAMAFTLVLVSAISVYLLHGLSRTRRLAG